MRRSQHFSCAVHRRARPRRSIGVLAADQPEVGDVGAGRGCPIRVGAPHLRIEEQQPRQRQAEGTDDREEHLIRGVVRLALFKADVIGHEDPGELGGLCSAQPGHLAAFAPVGNTGCGRVTALRQDFKNSSSPPDWGVLLMQPGHAGPSCLTYPS